MRYQIDDFEVGVERVGNKWRSYSSRNNWLIHLSQHDSKKEAVEYIMENVVFANDMQRRKAREILEL